MATDSYARWTVSIPAVTTETGGRARLAIALSRSAAALPEQRVRAILQSCRPFSTPAQQSLDLVFAEGSPDAAPVAGATATLTVDLGEIATVPAGGSDTLWHVRFFLDGNTPVGFARLRCQTGGNGAGQLVKIGPVGATTFRVPADPPPALDFAIFVTATTNSDRFKAERFELALSQTDAASGGVRLESLGVFPNPNLVGVDESAGDFASDLQGLILSTNAIDSGTPYTNLPGHGVRRLLGAPGKALFARLWQPGRSGSTVMILTEDLGFPWELAVLDEASRQFAIAGQPAQAGVDDRFLGQVFAVARWPHAAPLPNDRPPVRVLGLIAPGSVDLAGKVGSETTVAHTVRQFSTRERLPLVLEVTDGSEDTFRSLFVGTDGKPRPNPCETLHLRGHGGFDYFDANAIGQSGAATPSPAVPVSTLELVAADEQSATLEDREREGAVAENGEPPVILNRFDIELSRDGRRLLRAAIRSSQMRDVVSGRNTTLRLAVLSQSVPVIEPEELFDLLTGDADQGQSKVRFVFLDFCDSGTDPPGGSGDSWLDALTHCGCAGFVATLWNVETTQSVLSTRLFYSMLLVGTGPGAGDAVSPAEAMRQLRATMIADPLEVADGLENLAPGSAPGFSGNGAALAYAVFGHPGWTLAR